MNLKYIFLFFGLTIVSSQLECALLDQTSPTYQAEQEALHERWFQAAQMGDLEIIQKLKDSVNVNAQNKEGRSALMYAACFGHTSIVTFLLNFPSIDINQQNNKKRTALMYAIMHIQYDVVKILLAHPKIKINMQDYDGDSALILACRSSKIAGEKLVELFINRPDLDINLRDNHGSFALMSAVIKENTPLVKLLLQRRDIDVNMQLKCGFSPLMFAVQDGSEEIVKLLLQNPKINLDLKTNSGLTALELARNRATINAEYARIVTLIAAKKAENQDAAEALTSVVSQIWKTALVGEILKDFCPEKDKAKFINTFVSKKRKNTENPDTSISCATCGTSENCVLLCSGCKSTHYCSKSCQKANWKEHKHLCKLRLLKTIL